jgi:hypothetical protein
LGKASHFAYIKFALTVRNRNGREPAAVELVGCSTDMQQGTLCRLVFLGDPMSPIDNPVSTNRRISQGDIRNVVVQAEFTLPMVEEPVLTTGIKGVLNLANNRDNAISVPFDANVIPSITPAFGPQK